LEKILSSHVKKLSEDLRSIQIRKTNDNSISLFEGLSENNLQLLLSNSVLKNFEAGRELVQQGDEVTYLYFVVEGQVKTLRSNEDGDEATIRMLLPGDTFMDAVIFMGGNSPISARATKNSKLLLIPARLIRQQVIRDGQLAKNLLQIITKHYKTAMQQIDSIITKSPVERLGYFFLKQHLEQNPSSLDINLPFQKSMIANHLGMTPETFSRALKKMKLMGIDISQEQISMKDSFVLCHFCDSDTVSSCPRQNSSECPLCDDGNYC
jgi:CRP-like cAMP-binding protein